MPTSRKLRKDGKVVYIPKSGGEAGSGASGYQKTNDIPVMRYNRQAGEYEVSKTKGYTTQKDGYTLNIQVDEGTYKVSMGGMIMDGKTYYSLTEAKNAIDNGIHDYIQKNPEAFKSVELAQNEILSRIKKGEKITTATSNQIRQKWFEEVRRNPYRYIK